MRLPGTHEGCVPRVWRLPGGDFAALRCYGSSQSSQQQSSAQKTNSTSGNSSPVSGDSSPINSASGTQYVAGGAQTFSVDPVVTGQALDTVTALVKQALQNQADTQNAIVNANGQNQNDLNSVLASVLSRDQAIAQNSATGGQSGTNSFYLYIIGGILAFAAVVFGLFAKKKS